MKDWCEDMKSDNIETMINDKENEVREKLFQWLVPRYPHGVETSMKGSNCVFDFVHLLCYICQKKIQFEVDHI